MGADVKMIREVGHSLKIEITDPVAVKIESYFKK